MWLKLTILFCLFLPQDPERTESQLVSEKMAFSFIQNANGGFECMISSQRKVRTVYPMLRLVNSTLNDEFELVQNTSWNEQTETLSKEVDRVEEMLDSGTVIQTTDLTSLLKAEKKAIDTFKSVLVSDQVQAIRNVFAVSQIRKIGLAAFLVHGNGKSILKLKPDQLAKIEKKYKVAVASAADDLRQAKRDLIRKLLNELTVTQKRNLERLVGKVESFSRTPSSIFLLQLEDRFLEKLKGDLVGEFEEYEGFCFSQHFSFELDGTLLVHRKNADSIGAKDLRVIDGLLYFCLRNSKDEDLNFSEEQRNLIRELGKRNAAYSKEEEELYSTHIQTKGYDGIDELAKKQFEKHLLFSRTLMGELLSVLNEKQQSELKKTSRMTELRNLGLLALLIHSDLVEELDLSDEQDKRLVEVGSKAALSLKKTLVDLESCIQEELIDCLDEPQKSIIGEMNFQNLPLSTGFIELHDFAMDPLVCREILESDESDVLFKAVK